jgi:hypothetical protein
VCGCPAKGLLRTVGNPVAEKDLGRRQPNVDPMAPAQDKLPIESPSSPGDLLDKVLQLGDAVDMQLWVPAIHKRLDDALARHFGTTPRESKRASAQQQVNCCICAEGQTGWQDTVYMP